MSAQYKIIMEIKFNYYVLYTLQHMYIHEQMYIRICMNIIWGVWRGIHTITFMVPLMGVYLLHSLMTLKQTVHTSQLHTC